MLSVSFSPGRVRACRHCWISSLWTPPWKSAAIVQQFSYNCLLRASFSSNPECVDRVCWNRSFLTPPRAQEHRYSYSFFFILRMPFSLLPGTDKSFARMKYIFSCVLAAPAGFHWDGARLSFCGANEQQILYVYIYSICDKNILCVYRSKQYSACCGPHWLT